MPPSLDPETREQIRDAARQQLQHFRGLASPTVRRRARLLAASGRVTTLESHEFGASARVQADGSIGRVLLLWKGPEAGRCTCTAFSRRATCEHVVALLDALLASLGGSVRATTAPPSEDTSPPTPSLDWLRRLESYRDAIDERTARSRTDLPPTSPPSDVRYVTRLVDRRGGAVLQLEAQARPISKTNDDHAWRALPFTAHDLRTRRRSTPPSAAALGTSHATVAAIATGAADSSWYLESVHRDITLARVERALARPLLHAARAAAPLLFSTDTAHLPLTLQLDGHAVLELSADDESRDVWTLRGRLRTPDGARHTTDHLLGVSIDGLVALRTSDDTALLAALDAPRAAPVLLDLARSPLAVPREDVEMLTVLSGVATLVGDGLRAAARPIEPTPWLRVDAPLVGRSGARMEALLTFDYAGTRVKIDDPGQVVQTLDGRATPRRRDLERARIDRFLELGARWRKRNRDDDDAEVEPPNATVHAARFLGLAHTLVEEGWRVVAEDRLLRAPTTVSVHVRSGVDWFDLEGGLRFGDEEIPFPRLLDAANHSRGYVELGDGSHGLLPESWLKRFSAASLGEPVDDAVRFDEKRAWILAALVERLDAEVDDPFSKLRDTLSHLAAPHPLEAPPGFEGELRPYQREGLGWLAMLDEVGLSGCLADDMGLGKTVQVLAYLQRRRASGAGLERPSLVVAPRSVVFNWLAEAERFAPDLPTLDFTGPGRWERLESAEPGTLLVTTYGTLRRDALELRGVPLDVAILDEAQAIKTRTSQTAKSARALDARRRVALTGTPMENHLGEIWSLVEFLNPGMLGAAAAFERLGAPRAKDDLIDEGRELLARGLRPILLRRRKSEVLDDLPPKTEQVLRAPLTGPQRTAYQELVTFYRSKLVMGKSERRRDREDDPRHFDMNVLAALTRLRQCACHPGLVDPQLVAERSGKLDLVLPMLEDLVRSGSKAIVFSSFTSLLGLVRTRLETLRVPYTVLDGSTRNRGERVERFQSAEGGMVFLISIKAGGSGLNLTAADYVFLLDPWWNPAVEAQAIDRAHRIGRTRPVHVYRVLTEDTVEAHVTELQAKKRELAEAVLSGATTTLADWSADDLAFLLS